MQSAQNVTVIGDVHGCLPSLQKLLSLIPEDSPLIFIGDIINRGPASLETLRLIYSFGDRAKLILGNHDMHLLATAAGAGKANRRDTIDEILNAPDAQQLIDWVRHQYLLYQWNDYTFVHAAIDPAWSLKKAKNLAAEVQNQLRSENWKDYLQDMYGNEDKVAAAKSSARMRGILNGFTRMRYVDAQGRLDFGPKMSPIDAPRNCIPWFDCPRKIHKRICFGHWSTLGLLIRSDVIAIDTGCLWGGSLTAIRLRDGRIFSEQCPQWAPPGC